jgi:multicomponent K+:H+ antiporter subunit C
VELLVASGIGLLTAAGVYLTLRGRTFPVVLGLTFLSYAVNVFIFVSGGIRIGEPPIVGAALHMTDPLPQALVLTAIVISFGMTAYLVVLAMRARAETGSDHVDAGPPDDDGGPR